MARPTLRASTDRPSAARTGLRVPIPDGRELRPLLHQHAAALEQIRAGIGRLHLVADHVRRIRALGRPVPEARSEPVRHRRDPQRPQQTAERQVPQLRPPWETGTPTPNGARAPSPLPGSPAPASTAAPGAPAGTRFCLRLPPHSRMFERSLISECTHVRSSHPPQRGSFARSVGVDRPQWEQFQ